MAWCVYSPTLLIKIYIFIGRIYSNALIFLTMVVIYLLILFIFPCASLL
jgi:hypothetical protein